MNRRNFLKAALAAPLGASEPPKWIPPPGTRVNISLNTLADVNPCPANNCAWSGIEGQQALFDWCGAAYVEDDGPLGSLSITGGGHGAYYGCEVYVFDLYTRLWRHLKASGPFVINADTPIDGSGSTPVDANGKSIGQVPAASHTYYAMQQLPTRFGGGPRGSTLLCGVHAAGRVPGSFGWSYVCDHSTGLWRRFSVNNFPKVPNFADFGRHTFDPIRGRAWSINNYGSTLSWLNPSTGVWTAVGAYPAKKDFNGGNSFYAYCSKLDCIVAFDSARRGTTAMIEAIKVSDGGLATNWQPATTTAIPQGFWPVSDHTPSVDWSPELNAFGLYHAGGSNIVYYLSAPAALGGTWTWRTETFAGAAPVWGPPTNIPETYNRFRWISKLQSWAWFHGVRTPVQLWRPSSARSVG